MNLVIFGAPGVGKGTIGSRLATILDIKHISIGQVFRDASKEEGPKARKLEELFSVGKPIPDEIAIGVIVNYICKDEFENGFIFDSPYNVEQTKAIDEVKKIDAAINLIVSEEIIIERLSTRRICKICNAIYNVKTLSPKVEGTCDVCGGELEQRKDDEPESIKERLRHYHKRAELIVEYYKKTGALVKVEITDADVLPEVNVKKTLDLLKEKIGE